MMSIPVLPPLCGSLILQMELLEMNLFHSFIKCIEPAISLLTTLDLARDLREQRFFRGIPKQRSFRPKIIGPA